MELTREAFAHRRLELRSQLADALEAIERAEIAVRKAESGLQAARGLREAIYGAQQEMDDLEKQLLGEAKPGAEPPAKEK